MDKILLHPQQDTGSIVDAPQNYKRFIEKNKPKQSKPKKASITPRTFKVTDK